MSATGRSSLVIVDYGSGNLRSAAKAFASAVADSSAGIDVVVSDEPERLRTADRVVLPGVGAFADCKAGLAARAGLIEALDEAVLGRARPFLGICVGMQLMATRGLEHGVHEGFDWISGEVVPLAPGATAGPEGRPLKVPHMGWNELAVREPPHPLLVGLATGTHMYFVHSYRLRCECARDVFATTDYGGPVSAVVARDNRAGVQCHPEKSQRAGLRLIANFLEWTP